MKVEIDIPISLVGFIRSLDVEELNDDRILSDIGDSEHYYELISYGLITALTDGDEEETAYFLTYLGKIVHEVNE